MHKIKHGFSLIELLVVVAIIGILAAVGTIGYQNYIEGTKIKALDTNRENIAKLLEADIVAAQTNIIDAATCYDIISEVAANNNASAKNAFTGEAEDIYEIAHDLPPPFTFNQGHFLLMCGDYTAAPANSLIVICSCEEETCTPAGDDPDVDVCPIPEIKP